MATYVLLIRGAEEASNGQPSNEQRRIGDYGAEPIESSLPIKWIASYAAFGGHDYVDVVDVPDDTTAGRVGELLRWQGKDVTVLGWDRFRCLIRAVKTAASRRAVVARE